MKIKNVKKDLTEDDINIIYNGLNNYLHSLGDKDCYEGEELDEINNIEKILFKLG
jgi:hypothetical protein